MPSLLKLVSTLAAFAAFAWSSAAQIVVDLDTGVAQPHPIAIPQFGSDAGAADYAAQITQVVREDLTSTGLFAVLNEAAYIQKDLDISVEPRFGDWR
ncbi:MAG: Tol-Pal system protein TolB, partial [Pseudomonadota bacterium]